MKFILVFLALVAVASGALVSSPTYTECSRYLLHTSGNLLLPEADYLPNVIIYDQGAGNLMTGTPRGPYFTAVEGDSCYWIPNGALNCAVQLWADEAHTIYLGTGMLNSTSFTVNGTTTSPGFHYAGGHIQLTTSITNPTSYVPPAQSYNFHNLNLDLYFPAIALLPMMPSATVSTYANGVSNVTGTLFLTVWGANGWNGTTWSDATRTTGLDLRVWLECSPSGGNTGHSTPCPTCPSGARIVPSACNDQHLPISQTVPGNCLVLEFSPSTSTTADNGCSSGSF